MIQQRTPLKRYTSIRTYTGLKRSTKPLPKFRKSSDPMLWSSHEADSKLSKYVIKRDGKCLKCGSKKDLTNSHFHGRGSSSTRYDPANCICLCKWCHSVWEYLKKPAQEYHTFMVNRLGQSDFETLAFKANIWMARSDAIRSCMFFLGDPVERVEEEINI